MPKTNLLMLSTSEYEIYICIFTGKSFIVVMSIIWGVVRRPLMFIKKSVLCILILGLQNLPKNMSKASWAESDHVKFTFYEVYLPELFDFPAKNLLKNLLKKSF